MSQGISTGGLAAGLAARRECVSGRVAEQAALALKLVARWRLPRACQRPRRRAGGPCSRA